MEFEKAGVPTVTVCSQEFYQLGRMESETLGMPSLPIVLVPHPFGSLEPYRVREQAQNVVEEIVKALTSQS